MQLHNCIALLRAPLLNISNYAELADEACDIFVDSWKFVTLRVCLCVCLCYIGKVDTLKIVTNIIPTMSYRSIIISFVTWYANSSESRAVTR